MMKKAIVLVLLAAFVVPAFADDAITLPEGVMRTRVIPSVTFINSAFDDDGERDDLDDGITLYNLSAAIEYGITDWLTAGLQWTPGWQFASDFEANDDIKVTGVYDLFVGAKVQVVGDRGLVPDPTIRFAVTPGVKIPLSQYDAEAESENAFEEKEFQPMRVDKGAWGLGGRIALDYVFSPEFYLNLYNETVFYLPVDQQQFNAEAVGAAALLGGDFDDYEEELEVKYGTELTFEVEAAYSMDMGGGVQLGLGLPVTYEWTGETEIDGDGQDDDSWTLGIGPNVSFFFTQWALPMEFEVGFSAPLVGENTTAANTLTLQIKNFLRF
jgi:hypothetical protein